ncbi:HK97 family phage prohead protease [Larkinella humicola]|nr:HK97 family phage prohead protease [Larkinella humicola]
MDLIEQRIYVTDIGIETRSVEEGGGIEFVGLGIPFNKPSRLLLHKDKGPFIEVIEPTAMDGCDVSEVLAVFNHDENRLLGANYSGTLRFETTPEGVKFRILKPHNSIGIDCAEWVRRGDIRGNSFKYTTAKDRWQRINGVLYRFVEKFKALLDLSLVTRAAFLQTSVSVDAAQRSYEAWEEAETRSTETTPGTETETEETAPESTDESDLNRVPIDPNTTPTDQRSVGDELAWYKAKNRAHQNSLSLCPIN